MNFMYVIEISFPLLVYNKQKRELDCSKKLVQENSNYMNELQSLDREKQEFHRTEERIRENEQAIEEMELHLRVRNNNNSIYIYIFPS